jgi:predicted SAM-dependent methyltransferase
MASNNVTLRSTRLPYRPLLAVLPLSLWRQLDFEWRLARVRLRGRSVRRSLRSTRGALVNVGCGECGQPGWVNIDMVPAESVNCIFDCRRSLPLQPGAARAIYTEHFFEHLDRFEEAPVFLSACLRALGTGGVLRIVVPDGEQYVRGYCAPGWEALRAFSPLVTEDDPERLGTKMDVVNHHFRQGLQHKWSYDYDSLERLLRDTGFREVVRSDYGESAMPELRIDSPHRRSESLYVEAVA